MNRVKTTSVTKQPVKESAYKAIRFIVARFEINDKTNPTNMLVGFTIINDENAQNCYIETSLPFTDCVDKSDSEICAMAHDKLKDRIAEAITKLRTKKFIIGTEFVPAER